MLGPGGEPMIEWGDAVGEKSDRAQFVQLSDWLPGSAAAVVFAAADESRAAEQQPRHQGLG
jgi:hypothetical protein